MTPPGTTRAMRKTIVGTLVTVAALAAAQPALADTPYGGAALRKGLPDAPTIAVVRGDNGTVAARLDMAYRCGTHDFENFVVRLTGTTNQTTFHAKGHKGVRGFGRLNLSLSGTFAGAASTGTVRGRFARKSCSGFSRKFALRAEST